MRALEGHQRSDHRFVGGTGRAAALGQKSKTNESTLDPTHIAGVGAAREHVGTERVTARFGEVLGVGLQRRRALAEHRIRTMPNRHHAIAVAGVIGPDVAQLKLPHGGIERFIGDASRCFTGQNTEVDKTRLDPSHVVLVAAPLADRAGQQIVGVRSGPLEFVVAVALGVRVRLRGGRLRHMRPAQPGELLGGLIQLERSQMHQQGVDHVVGARGRIGFGRVIVLARRIGDKQCVPRVAQYIDDPIGPSRLLGGIGKRVGQRLLVGEDRRMERFGDDAFGDLLVGANIVATRGQLGGELAD